MAEFVKVGGTDFVGKNVRIAFSQIPEVVEIEDNARGWVGGMGVSLQPAGAFKESKQVRFPSLVEERLVRYGLIQGDHGFRSGAKFGRQTGADLFDARRSKLV